MAVHLITGYKGTAHIQSKDARSFNAAIFGADQYVLEIGKEFEASILNNNTVRVLDGDILMQGGHIRLETDTYEDMTITTGSAGTNRNDLIVMTYEKDSNDGTEDAYLEVIKGTEASGTASDPTYIEGNLAEGALKNQMPLYRVKLEGVVLSAIEPLFTVYNTLDDVIDDLKKSVSDGKTLVANAITAKGVTTATDATFATMADNISQISTTSVEFNQLMHITNPGSYETVECYLDNIEDYTYIVISAYRYDTIYDCVRFDSPQTPLYYIGNWNTLTETQIEATAFAKNGAYWDNWSVKFRIEKDANDNYKFIYTTLLASTDVYIYGIA